MGKYWPLRQMLIIRYINSLSTAFQVDHTCQRGFFLGQFWWLNCSVCTAPKWSTTRLYSESDSFRFIFSSCRISPKKIWHLIHFYADGSQIYLPLKGNDSNSLSLLYFDDIKGWTALMFLNLLRFVWWSGTSPCSKDQT